MLRELKLSPLEKKLRQQTLEMGYPDFKAFRLADRLFGVFLKNYYEDKIINKQRDEKEEATLFLMGSALKSTKDLYLKNGVNINEDSFFKEEYLDSFPLEEDMREGCATLVDATTIDVKDLYISVAKNLCKKVEDDLNSIAWINPLKSNPRQMEFVKKRLKRVEENATYAKEIGRIISGYDAPERGGPLTASMQYLSDWKLLFNFFQRNEIYEPISKALQGHANLHNLRFNGSAYSFVENTGEEIENIMEIAEVFFREFHAATGFVSSNKEKNVVFPGNSRVGFYSQGDDVRKSWRKNIAETVGGLMLEGANNLGDTIREIKNPFNFLGSKLHSLGVPFELSENIVDYFSRQIAPTLDSKNKRFTKTRVHAEMHKEGCNYVDAVRELVRYNTGKTPNKIKFRYFDDGNSRDLANAIGPVIYIARNDDGKIDILRQDWTKQSESEALTEISEQYEKGDADIYVRENRGVCYIWGTESSSDTVPPRSSIIETRFASKPIKEKDDLASKLAQRQIDIHEVIHAAQVGSTLVNRDAASFACNIVCQEAIQQIQDGRIDQEVPYYRTESLRKVGETQKNMLLDLLDGEVVQYLGTGNFADLIRKNGIHGALWSKGIQYVAGFDMGKLRKKIPLENCPSTKNVLLLREMIENNDLEGLKRMRQSLCEHSEEATMLIETAAESFSLLAMKDHIMNFPNARISQAKREQYYKDLEGGILTRGYVGRNFLDATYKASSPVEQEELLREKGLVYQHIVLDRHNESVERRLINLGYPVLNPFSAYEDMVELRGRLRKKRMGVDKVLFPMNYARAYLDEKYSAHIPLMQGVIQKYGGKEAFKKIHSIETLDQLRQLAE